MPNHFGGIKSDENNFPSSVIDNKVVRWDGTSGKKIQNSNVTIDDSGNINASGGISTSGCVCAYCGFYCSGYGGWSGYFRDYYGSYVYVCGGVIYSAC